MDLNLQPLAQTCHLSGKAFVDGDRVLSVLVRVTKGDETTRFDVLADEGQDFAPEGREVCRWVHVFKERKSGANPERELKLTAESLFLTLADPQNERSDENERMLQVLGLMLERKKVLRPKGYAANGRALFEHAKTKTVYEVTAEELNPEFFLSIQEQLAALVGGAR